MPASKRVLPISKDEFAQYIRACLPRTKRRAIVVANSGGPDSTCLLFLLQRWARSLSKSHFHRILSCSVDHNLQPSSAQWMSHTARFAARLNVDHRSARVTWGDGRFPPKPTSGAKGKLELAAREARYALLHELMCSAGADVAAFGHHADDQVETAILRALKGSSELGLAGMKPCRRFGMGSRGELGHEGLRRWIVRPLLPVSKDRILATCDEHKLEYVVDSTNFQPDLTLRNAIRKAVEERVVGPIQRFDPSLTKSAIEDRLSALDIPLDISTGAPALRHAAQQLSRRAQRVEEATTIALKACSLTSPAGALTLFVERLRRISDLAVMKGDNILPLVQRNLITRVLRYASPHPWGTLQAEANRQTQSLDRIREALFGSDPASLPQNPSQALPSPAPFSAGAGVLWTPALFVKSSRKPPGKESMVTGSLKFGIPAERARALIANEQAEEVWVASRLPPMRKRGHASPVPERRDITEAFLGSNRSFLVDNRFLVSFDNLSTECCDLFRMLLIERGILSARCGQSHVGSEQKGDHGEQPGDQGESAGARGASADAQAARADTQSAEVGPRRDYAQVEIVTRGRYAVPSVVVTGLEDDIHSWAARIPGSVVDAKRGELVLCSRVEPPKDVDRFDERPTWDDDPIDDSNPIEGDADQVGDIDDLLQSRMDPIEGDEGYDPRGRFPAWLESQVGLNEDRPWLQIQWVRPL